MRCILLLPPVEEEKGWAGRTEREGVVSLRTIVRALGGDLYDGGRRANIPAPGHSAFDRSVSLLLENGRVIVHTFGDGDWRAVLDDLRDRHLIDAANAPRSLSGAQRATDRAAPTSGFRRRDAALRLWEVATSLPRTLSERHCRLRGIVRGLPEDETLRHLGEAPVSAYKPTRHHRPALIAAIRTAAGDIAGVEVTYLAPNGHRATDLRLSRKTVGLSPGGCAVRLDPPAAEMLVAEGVFTTLSASEWFGLPGWALLSTRNLRAWTAPEEARSVLIAADRGLDGETSAEALRARLVRQGLAATIALPPHPFGDWNDWSAAGRAAACPSVAALLRSA